MIRIGLIGYGYWGPNLARAAAETDGATVEMIADFSGPARERAAKRHPSARLATDWMTHVQEPKVDAVLVATPVKTHFEIGLGALAAGKHVLIEKPLADSPARAARLVDEAMRRSRILMVDHTFVFTGAVKTIQELVELQNAYAKASIDALVSESTKMQELTVKIANEALAPLSARVNATVEVLSKKQVAA